MSIRQNQICRRLSCLGLKQHQVHAILDQIALWKRNNGTEWTVSRLKDMKTMAIHRLAGKTADVSSWISTHVDGSPKGVFRPLWKGIDSGNHKQIAKAINALLVYTDEIRHGYIPTEAQWKKFQRAVENPIASQSFSLKWSLPEIRLSKPQTIFSFAWSSEKNAPGFFREGTVPETEFEPQWNGFFQSWDSLKLIKKFPDIYDRVLGGNLYRQPPASHDPFENRGVGKISFLQEPGYKMRAIANPHRFHQIALEPLKKGLMGILSNIPEDCTHDQSKGVKWAETRLQEGVTLHALDLSNATDAFPANVTFSLLRDGQSEQVLEYIDLFEEISRSPWIVLDPEHGMEPRQMTWVKGQPLGLGPSFPAFALTHHAVLRTLMCEHKGDYRILGDDIIIEGDSLAAAYRDTCKVLGVDISESKSISSNQVTEFAGKLILPGGVIPTVKWREISDRNFVDYTRFFGHQFIGALRPRQKAVAKRIFEIPELHGGLGFNPNGKPWEVRVDENWIDILNLFPQEQTLVSASDSTLSHAKCISVGIIHPRDIQSVTQRATSYPDECPLDEAPGYTSNPESIIGFGWGEKKDDGVLSTESSLTRIASITGITEGVYPVEDNPFTPSEREDGDPRGRSSLDILERKLKLTSLGSHKKDRQKRSFETKLERNHQSDGTKPSELDEDLNP
jgi:hypothetical protein